MFGLETSRGGSGVEITNRRLCRSLLGGERVHHGFTQQYACSRYNIVVPSVTDVCCIIIKYLSP